MFIGTTLAKLAAVDAVFAEVHEDPDNAPCDGPNMLKLEDLENILITVLKIDEIAKSL